MIAFPVIVFCSELSKGSKVSYACCTSPSKANCITYNINTIHYMKYIQILEINTNTNIESLMWNDGWMWINICIGSIISICVSVYSIQLQYWAIEYTCIFFFQKISPIVKYKNFVSFDFSFFSFCSLHFYIFILPYLFLCNMIKMILCVCVCMRVSLIRWKTETAIATKRDSSTSSSRRNRQLESLVVVVDGYTHSIPYFIIILVFSVECTSDIQNQYINDACGACVSKHFTSQKHELLLSFWNFVRGFYFAIHIYLQYIGFRSDLNNNMK